VDVGGHGLVNLGRGARAVQVSGQGLELAGTASSTARCGDVTEVAYRLEPRPGGTRFSYEHTGFTGVGGILMATLLGHVRRKMLNVGLPAVLDDLDEVGTLRPGSTLRPKSRS